jgi:GNAT superfamily N-acetyltransferase
LRLAGAGDLALLVAQGADFFAGAHELVPRPSPARLEIYLSRILETSTVAIAEDPRGYVGSLALELAPWAWSDELALRDHWLHVVADRRRSSVTRRLIAFGLALARRRGVPLYLGNSLGVGRARLLSADRRRTPPR